MPLSDGTIKAGHEGSLEAPTRHPLNWQDPGFNDPALLEKELERVFDICHGCRRCFNLCNAFPTLFELIDESKTGELNGGRPTGLSAGGRSLLPVRHVLHDQVSVRAAASLECGFSPLDAARQGREVSRRGNTLARQGLEFYGFGRHARGHSRHRRGC